MIFTLAHKFIMDTISLISLADLSVFKWTKLVKIVIIFYYFLCFIVTHLLLHRHFMRIRGQWLSKKRYFYIWWRWNCPRFPILYLLNLIIARCESLFNKIIRRKRIIWMRSYLWLTWTFKRKQIHRICVLKLLKAFKWKGKMVILMDYRR